MAQGENSVGVSCEEGDLPCLKTENVKITTASKDDGTSLKGKLDAAIRNIAFLKEEHAKTIAGLHQEIDKLQQFVKDLQFQWDILEVVVPNNDFFNCDRVTLEQKVNQLIKDNSDLQKRIQESHKALQALDQKQKLEQWQHLQEMGEKEKTIKCLQEELEAKCSTIAEQSSRSKKKNFLRMFSFNAAPQSSSRKLTERQLCQSSEDELRASSADFPSSSHSPCHSLNLDDYSLSDRSTSEEEVYRSSPFLQKQYTFPSPKHGFRHKYNQSTLKLPPLPCRELVRQQIRVDNMDRKAAIDSIVIDNVTLPEVFDPRIN